MLGAPTRSVSASARQVRARTPVSLDHNPFCPSCKDEPESEPVVVVDPDAPFGGAPQTALPLALLATMEASPASLSLATISNEGRSGAFMAGDVVLPGVRIRRIASGTVVLDNRGRAEVLGVDMRRKLEPKKKPRREPKKKRTKKRRRPWEIEGARDAIDCDGAKCTVERAFVRELVANPAALARQARVRPYARAGVEGFRLTRVRRGTLPRLLGLRSGDVVTEVNGRALKTMDAALTMASRLATASHLSVDVARRRRGKTNPITIEIQIVS